MIKITGHYEESMKPALIVTDKTRSLQVLSITKSVSLVSEATAEAVDRKLTPPKQADSNNTAPTAAGKMRLEFNMDLVSIAYGRNQQANWMRSSLERF